ncbi:MAG TPA: tetratricopeptide repeat protein [Verrucomicrobiae bacterium]|nr:tetratricopeptide repeat protein [Verrucomicrobiae bacterium]
MGGVGKTALAVALAHQLKDQYPDAQVMLNLRGADPDRRPPLSSAEAMQNVIHAFAPEAKLPNTVDELKPIYLSVLQEGNHRILLLLDNAASPEQIEPLLPPSNCLLLVTSRAHFTLPGLKAKDIGCLKPDQSVKLLLKLAPRIGEHAAHAAELCGHLPLALEIVAGIVNDKRLYPVQDILTRLETKQEKPPKVDAAFEVSYDLLSETLRRQWCQLSVFPASFDLRAAAAVWESDQDAARDNLQVLFNASLVEWNEATNRFRLHDLIRDFCNGKLSSDDRSAAQLRHSEHYSQILDEAGELLLKGGDSILHGLAVFDTERTNIEAGQAWATAQPADSKVAAQLCVEYPNAGVYVLSLRQHPRQRIAWLEAAVAGAQRLRNRRAEGVSLGNLGLAHAALGETHRAIELYERRVAIARESGDRRGEGSVLGNLASAYAELGETRRAIELYEQRLAIARESGDRRGEANALSNLGVAYANAGEARRAVELYEQALAIDRKTGDRRGEANTLGNLGNAYGDLGEPRRAIEFYEQALGISREIGDRRGEANALGNLGIARAITGETPQAIKLCEEQLVIAREIGDRRGEGNALFNMSLALDKLGKRTEAIHQAEAALRVYEQIEDPHAEQVRQQLAVWRSKK